MRPTTPLSRAHAIHTEHFDHPLRPDGQTILLICVNYRADDLTLKLMHTALGMPATEQLHVIAVDNGAHGGESALPAYIAHPRAQVVVPPRNLGYFAGAAYGLEVFLRTHPMPDWVIVSNVDIRFATSDFFATLRSYEAGQDVGILAPAIRSDFTGKNQNPFIRHRPWRGVVGAYEWVCKNRLLVSCYRLFSLTKTTVRSLFTADDGHVLWGDSLQPTPVYAPHGSCIIFHKNYFAHGGHLNYSAFLFGEELFVAEMARQMNLHVVYEPRLRIHHQDHVSTGLVHLRFEKQARS